MVGLTAARAATIRCWTQYRTPSNTTRAENTRPIAKSWPSISAGDIDRSSPNEVIVSLRTSDWYSSEPCDR